MSEASLVRDQHEYIVGGANSAGQAAILLAEYARKVTMLVRGRALKDSMSSYLSTRILSHPNNEVLFETVLTDLAGPDALDRIALMNPKTRRATWVEASHLFVVIGGIPNTEWAKTPPDFW